jgi:tRNA pseudouridine38-40 synthase
VAVHTVALRIAYDGRRFDAYARHNDTHTVEDHLLRALRTQGYVEDSFKTGSRTDAGVSALENVCRAQVERKTLRGLVPSLQKEVPDGLWITGAATVPDEWNPRHAKQRSYRYVAVPHGETLARMKPACKAFVGRHLMSAFAKMEEGRNPMRTVMDFTVEEHEGLWLFRTVADGYLWNQVRRMVGAVQAVGRGEAEVADVEASLTTGVKHDLFHLASPAGLLLESVQHPGLEWDLYAGRLGPHRVPQVLQEADVGFLLARHLHKLAPWPKPDLPVH